MKIDREGASLTSCSNSFQTFDPRNENAFWPLLVFIRGTSKSVSQFLKFTISLVESLVKVVEITLGFARGPYQKEELCRPLSLI